MNFPLRRLGLFLLFLIVAGIGTDLFRNQIETVSSQPTTGGFKQDVPGLGTIETSFSGEVEFSLSDIAFNDGTKKYLYTKVVVKGHDPSFSETQMELPDAVISQFDQASGELIYQASSKLAHIYLDPNSLNLKLDKTQRWNLVQPNIEFLFGETSYQLTSDSLWLDVQSLELGTALPFDIQGDRLELSSKSFSAKLKEELFHFGGNSHLSKWKMTESADSFWTGKFDGPGVAHSVEGVTSFRFDKDTTCFVSSPNQARVDCSYFKMESGLIDNYLTFKESEFGPPCEITYSQNERPIVIQCNGAEPQWDNGTLSGIHLRPPTHLIANSNSWATTNGGAWIGNENDASLWGGITGELPSGSFQANSLNLTNGELHALGNVAFANSGASCDELWHYQNQSTELIGNVYLDNGDGVVMSADKILLLDNKQLSAFGNVKASFKEEGTTTHCQADEFEYAKNWHGTELCSIRANGNVRFEKEDVRILGDSLRLVENTRAELTGWPATAFLNSDPNGARIIAERFLWEDDNIYPSGGPAVKIPANKLGLAGGIVSINSQRMRFNTSTSEWQILGDVMLSGAIVGSAQKISGNNELATMVPGSGNTCSLTGSLENGDYFSITSEKIDVIKGAQVHLVGSAEAVIKPKGGRAIQLRGREANLSSQGGWFQYNVEISSDDTTGKADRVNWENASGKASSINLIGSARLEDSTAQISGHNIQYDLSGESIFVSGGDFSKATINLNNGQTATGDWLQFDSKNYLLAGAKGKVEEHD